MGLETKILKLIEKTKRPTIALEKNLDRSNPNSFNLIASSLEVADLNIDIERFIETGSFMIYCQDLFRVGDKTLAGLIPFDRQNIDVYGFIVDDTAIVQLNSATYEQKLLSIDRQDKVIQISEPKIIQIEVKLDNIVKEFSELNTRVFMLERHKMEQEYLNKEINESLSLLNNNDFLIFTKNFSSKKFWIFVLAAFLFLSIPGVLSNLIGQEIKNSIENITK